MKKKRSLHCARKYKKIQQIFASVNTFQKLWGLFLLFLEKKI